MLARILTDTITSRPPHCVLGARYDGNVNLFYVVMTGFYQTEILNGISRYKLSISSSRFCGGATQKIIREKS
jgi:hypothetical protein